ncbi:MAG: 30S ribosomal protein S7 [Bacteroidales bacterium]|jgi:small subunit ribosomal protein S7
MRKIKAKKRFLLPDPKFKDVLVTRFINTLMQRGKKNLSSKVFYDAIAIVEKKIGENGLEVWRKALANITPAVEVRSRRIGGATFQIPQEIRPDRRISMAIKWLITYARGRSEKSMSEKLAAEIMAAYKEEGASFKKKDDTHRMAEANKAFSHFRF